MNRLAKELARTHGIKSPRVLASVLGRHPPEGAPPFTADEWLEIARVFPRIRHALTLSSELTVPRSDGVLRCPFHDLVLVLAPPTVDRFVPGDARPWCAVCTLGGHGPFQREDRP